jgi:hypothetical protein
LQSCSLADVTIDSFVTPYQASGFLAD